MSESRQITASVPFSSDNAGGFNCAYASAARAAGICIGIRGASENGLVKLP
jgi:hypothetical protein